MRAAVENVCFTLKHFEGYLILGVVDGLRGANLPVKQACSMTEYS
jgi:hypothetical protein